MQSSPQTMMFWNVLAILVSFFVCALGLQNGIEKITKVMMSVLIIIMIILAIHSLLSPGAMKGVAFYLIPDFSSVAENGIGNTIFAAMSHAFLPLVSAWVIWKFSVVIWEKSVAYWARELGLCVSIPLLL